MKTSGQSVREEPDPKILLDHTQDLLAVSAICSHTLLMEGQDCDARILVTLHSTL